MKLFVVPPAPPYFYHILSNITAFTRLNACKKGFSSKAKLSKKRPKQKNSSPHSSPVNLLYIFDIYGTSKIYTQRT